MSEFLDAKQRNTEHPDTFLIPNQKELDTIKPEENVKICENYERFWVEVTEVDGEKITGRVNNDLVNTHEFKCDDIISFKKENVMDIYR